MLDLSVCFLSDEIKQLESYRNYDGEINYEVEDNNSDQTPSS